MSHETALHAIIARINGTWNSPHLQAFGPLSTSTIDDVLHIAKSATATAPINPAPDLTALRTAAADHAFDNFDFLDDRVEDSNGWQHDGGDDYRRVVFLKNPEGGDSNKAVFIVEFTEGTASVQTTSVEYD